MHIRKMRPFAAALAVITVLAAISVGCAGAQAETSVDELLSLGEKYLSELHYDQALAQFLQAIELEPRSAEAYLGAAEAYVGMGQLDEAIAILERGIEPTGDERLRERLEALLAVQAPENQHEALPVEDPVVARTLYEYLLAGDNEAAYAYCLSEEFLAACAALEEGAFRFYGDIGAQGELEGLAVAYYPYRYVYFGGWKDGAREGESHYFRIEENRRWIYEGSWAGGLPNGPQIKTLYRKDAINDERRDQPYESITTGACVDGLWHGEIEDVWFMASGKIHRWSYRMEDGVNVAIGEPDEDGSYPIAYCSDCGVELSSDPGDVEGIPPFDSSFGEPE